MTPSRRPPVEGRPRCFFGISLIDFAMNSGYPKSKPRGSLNFRPGPNPNHEGSIPWLRLPACIARHDELRPKSNQPRQSNSLPRKNVSAGMAMDRSKAR